VDVFARDLHDALKRRNLTEIVDVIFVSDHGMTDTSHPEPVYVDDILGDGFDKIEHDDGMGRLGRSRRIPSMIDLFCTGWPSMGLRFHEGVNTSHYLDVLLKAANDNPDKFNVYTHETMPQRYHYSNNVRIAPIWVIPKLGYALTNHRENGLIMSKGVRVLQQSSFHLGAAC
jgi:predicted AlkP superfamily pyrophosphatase or phosphodiesterase